MPKPFTNIVVSPSRADARPKVLDKAPVGTPPALPTHTYPQMWINPKPFVDKLDAKQEGAVTAKLSTAPAANESLWEFGKTNPKRSWNRLRRYQNPKTRLKRKQWVVHRNGWSGV